MLNNRDLRARIGFDTAENGRGLVSKVWVWEIWSIPQPHHSQGSTAPMSSVQKAKTRQIFAQQDRDSPGSELAT